MRGLGRTRDTGYWASKGWVQWSVAAIIFFLISWFYMGAALTSCTTTTTAFNSDSSGGLAWFQWASGNHLSWGTTHKSNYPIGESLQRPQFVTSISFDVAYRIFSTITNPICGLNLMVLMAYMSTALLMFGLIRWLFKKNGIALFAGYAAAFLPYHQIKSESHIVYMYSSIFIAIIWVFLWYVRQPSYKRMALLAVLAAIGFYFDGYFILFTSVLTVILLSALFINDIRYWRPGSPPDEKHKSLNINQLVLHLKHLLFFIIIMAVLLLPIAYTALKYGGEIKQTLTSGRGNIQAEALTYGARPAEFLLPAYDNAFVPQSYKHWRLVHQHFSNISEDTLYVGLTVAILSILAIANLFRPKVRGIKLKGPITYSYIVVLSTAALAICIWLSMPSKLNVLGDYIKMPSDVIIKFTSDWRVFARFILLIDPWWVILAAAGLYVLTRNLKRLYYIILLAICCVVIFCEFLASPIRSSGNLYTDSPKIYQTIKNDKSVKVIAEYPLTNLVDSVSYFTFQQIHGKDLVNANDPSVGRDPFHMAIAGINDRQTLGTLKALGVNVVTSYGYDDNNNPGLTIYRPADVTKHGGIPTIYSYRINNSVKADHAVLVADTGFDYFSIDTRQESHRVLLRNGSMEVISPLTRKPVSVGYNIGFDAQSIVGKDAVLVVKQDGHIIWQGDIKQAATMIRMPIKPGIITVSTSEPIDITNMYALSAAE